MCSSSANEKMKSNWGLYDVLCIDQKVDKDSGYTVLQLIQVIQVIQIIQVNVQVIQVIQ